MKCLSVLVLVVGLASCCQGVSTCPVGRDFQNHREFGRRILADEPLYAGGLNVPYPPYWALVHAPLACVSEVVAFRIHVALGLMALGVLVALSVAAARRAHGQASSSLALAGLLLLVASRAILRDLQDGGANLIIVALVWSALHVWLAGRPATAGLLLGQAIALKCTPAFFLIYFMWKRQWRVACIAFVSMAAFLVLPVLWQGPDRFQQHLELWASHLRQGLETRDPRIGVLGVEEVRNLSLKPTLGRILLDTPGLDVNAAQATLAIQVVSLLLVAGVLWWCREGQGSTACAQQCAAILVLLLLLSPITWLPHSVAALPALALVCSAVLSGRWRRPSFLLVVGVMLLLLRGPVNPAFVGAGVSAWLQWYGATTWALLALVLLSARAGSTHAALPSGMKRAGCPSGRPSVCASGPMTLSCPR